MVIGSWRSQKDGIAHLVVNGRSRCAVGFVRKGSAVSPPKMGVEPGYCYNCHYHSIFDTMPKTKTEVLTKLLNREVDTRIRAERDQYRVQFEEREKNFQVREDSIRKREDEVRKLLDVTERDKEFAEVGKAFALLSEHVGNSIMKSSEKFYEKYSHRRMGW